MLVQMSATALKRRVGTNEDDHPHHPMYTGACRGAVHSLSTNFFLSWLTWLETQSFMETSKPCFVLVYPLSDLTLPISLLLEITDKSATWEESVFRYGSKRVSPAYTVRMTCNLSCAQVLS